MKEKTEQERIQRLRKKQMVAMRAKGVMTEIRLEAERREKQRLKEAGEREKKRLEALKVRRKMLWKESQNVMLMTRMNMIAAEQEVQRKKAAEKEQKKIKRIAKQKAMNERLAAKKATMAEADAVRVGPNNEEKKVRTMQLVQRLAEAEERLEADRLEHKLKLAKKLHENEERRQTGKQAARTERKRVQEMKESNLANKTLVRSQAIQQLIYDHTLLSGMDCL